MTWLLLGTWDKPTESILLHQLQVLMRELSVRGKPRARELVLGVGWQRKERELTAPTAAGRVFNKPHGRTPTEYRQ